MVLWVIPLLCLIPLWAVLVAEPDEGTSAFWGAPAGWMVEIAAGAFAALSVWWVLDGFGSYERKAGIRVLARTSVVRRPLGPLWVTLAIAVGGLTAFYFGVHSPWLAIVIAIATAASIMLLLLRRFAVFASLSIFGIMIGVAALIVVQSVATGFIHEFERRVLGVYAHINVTRAAGLSEYRRLETYLRTVPGVVGASPFVYYLMALAPVGEGENEPGEQRRAAVLVKGIDPQTAGQVIDLATHLRRGSEQDVDISELQSEMVLEPASDRGDGELPPAIAQTPDPLGPRGWEEAFARWQRLPPHKKYGGLDEVSAAGDWPQPVTPRPSTELDASALPTMFVGYSLAEQLDIEAGDVVVLVDPGATFDHTQMPELRHYRVAGIFRAGFQEYDTRLVYVDIKEVQYFKYRGRDLVSGVDLRLADPYAAPEVERYLRQEIGGRDYSILEWQKLNASLFESIRVQKGILTVILSLVTAVAGFNVLAGLWTMVVRRTAEIAIIMSMGATEASVARIFQFAGTCLGALGCAAGVVLGLVLCWLVELYGYTLDPEVYYIERLPVEVSAIQILIVIAVTMGMSFIATIPPSLRAAKLRPVEGLRYE